MLASGSFLLPRIERNRWLAHYSSAGRVPVAEFRVSRSVLAPRRVNSCSVGVSRGRLDVGSSHVLRSHGGQALIFGVPPSLALPSLSGATKKPKQRRNLVALTAEHCKHVYAPRRLPRMQRPALIIRIYTCCSHQAASGEATCFIISFLVMIWWHIYGAQTSLLLCASVFDGLKGHQGHMRPQRPGFKPTRSDESVSASSHAELVYG